ncbi:FAD-dependent oxidoreductase [Kineococcus sp. SYSU DK003]|uniref:FAD-dependent oxidoreductase n=1 Tax=Kineococcus sp. SYSU DK003 TaxID=3383124 RepID=UPI003D7C8FFB
MSDTFDVVVTGLGIHGSAAAFELASRGERVLGLDRFPEGHVRGSSHGRTRMIRRAYPNPVWNDLVERAQHGWARWERTAGRSLVHRTGGLYAHPGSSQLQGPGCVCVQNPDALRSLAPGLSLPPGWAAVHDPSAGVVEASTALRVARDGARRLGADLAFGERVLRWEQTGDGCLVQTDRRTVRTRRLVLAGGAWNGELEPSLAGLFTVWRILTATFRPGQPVAQPPSLTAFSVDRPDGLVFGLPDVDGSGLKVGIDAEHPWDPELPPTPPTAAEVDRLVRTATALVPGLEPDVVETAACLYTMTEDKRFVLGALPHAPAVVVAAACSGHGFKFGPAVGEAVADLCQGVARPDLDFIGIDRRVVA